MTQTINQVYEFAAAAALQNILSNAEYLESSTRNTGHLPGIALQAVENAALRNLSRFCRGVAQFIAERYPDGVVDDGDTAKIVAGLSAAILGLVKDNISIAQATETVAGVIKLSTNAQALAGEEDATAMSPVDVAAAIIGVVRGYTRQQFPAQVARTGASGAQAVDLDLHQALAITATGPIVMSAPTRMVAEKWCTLRFASAAAQTISWDAAWHGTSLAGLPTVTVAGKVLTCSFVCLGTYMVLMGMVLEA
jgi:hypothetical protein